MIGILKKIWKKFKEMITKDNKELEKENNDSMNDIQARTLLNTFYLHPEIVKEMPYELLYNDIFEEIGQMIDTLERQWNQNEIDYALGYISMDVYCDNRISIREKFDQSKKRYLQAMNLA